MWWLPLPCGLTPLTPRPRTVPPSFLPPLVAQVILEIEHTDAGFRPGAFYIGVYSSLLDCPFLLCVKCHEDPVKVRRPRSDLAPISP